MPSTRLFFVCCATALLVGCGARQEPWGSVEGQVTLAGQPIVDATILFSDDRRGIALSAQSDAQGHFKIRSAKVPGVPTGTYRVAVIPVVNAAEMPQYSIVVERPPPEIKSPIAPRYRDPKTTDLSATVNAGENRFEFALQPK